MSSCPFFSIILPTKNRSHILGSVIQSVLNQAFADYELIVVDNDDNDATQKVVAQFDDPRIRHCRTGGLSQQENWNYGIEQARGEYLTILPDKQVYYLRTLERLHQHLIEHQPQVATWLIDALYDETTTYTFTLLHRKLPIQAQWSSAVELMDNLLRDGDVGGRNLPKGSNSCVHHSLVEKIISGPAGHMCHIWGTDTTMAFIQVAYVDSVLHIDEALGAIIWTNTRGHNRNFMFKNITPEIKFFIEKAGGIERIYNRVPLKIWTIVNNMHFNDFLNMQALVGGNLAKLTIDPVRYFAICYREISEREIGLQVDMRDEEKQWEATLREQPAAVQIAVNETIEKWKKDLQHARRQRRNPYKLLNQIRYRLGTLRNRFVSRSTPSPATIRQSFPSIHAAIEWEAQQAYNQVSNSHPSL